MSSEHIIETDVLVIGGATAGCFAAIKAREQGLDVTIVDKAYAGKSGASMAACGYWVVFNPEWGDDWDATMKQVSNRADLYNQEWSEIMLKESLETYENLVDWGVEIPITRDKRPLDYWSEEIVRGRKRGGLPPHVPGNPYSPVPLRFRKTTPFLRKQAEKVGAKIMDRIMITDLIKQDGKVVGAIGFPTDSYDLYIFKAKATILSAGGGSFNPFGSQVTVTNDADGMAYRAGAEFSGREFCMSGWSVFAGYPAWKTELYPAYFTTVDAEGKPSTMRTIHEGGGPISYDFDAATPEDIEAMQAWMRKRNNPIELERIGVDLNRRGKYQLMGGAAVGYTSNQSSGIWTINTKCATNLPGFYAAGDACGSRCNGAANPWGGLLPAAITGKRAAAGAAEYAMQTAKPVIDEQELARLKQITCEYAERKGGFSPRWVTQLLRNTMIPYYILSFKHGDRLQAALTTVEFLRDHMVPKLVAKDPHELRLAHETKNMILGAEIVLRSSLFRTESRGMHFREDYPERNDSEWLVWTKLKEEQGQMKLWKEPIPE